MAEWPRFFVLSKGTVVGRSAAIRVFGALVAVAVATFVRGLLDPYLGDHQPFAPFFCAIVVAAWFGGLASALVATIGGYLAADYFFISPRRTLSLFDRTPEILAGLLNFSITGLAIAFFGAFTRRQWCQVKEGEARLSLALNAGRFGIWDWDIQTDILTLSQRAREILAAFVDVKTGEEFFQRCVHPTESDSVRAELVEIGKGAQVSLNREFRILTASSEERWVSLVATAFRVPGAPVMRVIGAMSDVSDRKRIEADKQRLLCALQDAAREKDNFLAMLAHELRNPLAAIQYANALMRLPNVPANMNLPDVIDRQVKNLVRIIDDLLDVSRLERGKISLRKESVSAFTLAERAFSTVRALLEERRHEIVFQPTGAPPYVDADPTRVEQMLVNFLTNAAKYTPDGGRIELTISTEGSYVRFAVKDNGNGITEAMLSKVFDLFTQGEATLARSQGGLGIGLTVVRKLAELHGGSAHVESEGLGKGSEFSFRIPGAAPPAAAERAVIPPLRASESRARKVLVVDDNLDMAVSMAELLRLSGCDVEIATDGEAALSAFRRFLPDVALIDIGLPVRDGFDVARALRAEHADRQTLLVAVSGYGQDEDRRRAHEAGFDAHLVKPVELESLHPFLFAESRSEARSL